MFTRFAGCGLLGLPDFPGLPGFLGFPSLLGLLTPIHWVCQVFRLWFASSNFPAPIRRFWFARFVKSGSLGSLSLLVASLPHSLIASLPSSPVFLSLVRQFANFPVCQVLFARFAAIWFARFVRPCSPRVHQVYQQKYLQTRELNILGKSLIGLLVNLSKIARETAWILRGYLQKLGCQSFQHFWLRITSKPSIQSNRPHLPLHG